MSTIAIVCCAEGLAIAGQVWHVQRKPQETFAPHTTNLFPIGNLSVAFATWGFPEVNYESVKPILNALVSTTYRRRKDTSHYRVSDVARHLLQLLRDENEETFRIRPDAFLGGLIAGYSLPAGPPQIFRFKIPYDDQPRVVQLGPSNTGAVFDGDVDPIHRLVFGLGLDVMLAFSKLNLDPSQLGVLRDALARHAPHPDRIDGFLSQLSSSDEFERFLALKDFFSYDLAFSQLALSDALELAKWLVTTCKDVSRFREGPPLLYGELHTLAISPTGFIGQEQVREYYVKSECKRLLEDCDAAASPAQKGRALEHLTEVLFTSNSFFELLDRRVSTRDEEIDMIVKNNLDRPFWNAMQSPLFFVECKNWLKPVGSKEVRDFEGKLRNHRRLVKLGFFVSMNGFTEGAHDELMRAGREEQNIVILTRTDIEDYIASDTMFYTWLEKKAASLH